MHNYRKWIAPIGLAAMMAASSAHAKDVVIHAGRLIDGTGKAVTGQVSILIHDDRITNVQTGFVSPAGAEVVDLSKQTVLPGLIDMHVHLTMDWHPGDPVANEVTRNASDDLIEAVNAARNTLLAGFTSARDVGATTASIVALKRAIEHNVIPGPRLKVSGWPISPTGGHNDPANGLDQELMHPHWKDSIVDSADDARRVVRLLHREGADLIKIMPSGGVASIGDDPSAQLMADDEIKAAIDTAHALHIKVAAHAHGKLAIDRAVELGVDSIEHGTYADAHSYAFMKAHGTYLVPTLLVAARIYERAKTHPEQLLPSVAEKALQVAPILQHNLGNAYKAGVKIAFGTDTFGLSRHGENAEEFGLMVEAGIPASDAILAATRNAADLLGDSANVGSVQPGHYADIIAVDGDPLQDVSVLTHVNFVMKGGAVVKAAGVAVSR